MTIVDAHQHFWRIGEPGHAWPTPDWPALFRDFDPDDLLAEAAGCALAGTVLVQSQPTDHDTDWMLALADRTPLVRAVVGWVDLTNGDAPARIATLAGHPAMRGLRPMLQAIDDTEWLLRPELDAAIAATIAHDLSFDALIQPRHLPMLARFARRWPALRIVVDHGAKPSMDATAFAPWADNMTRLAEIGLYAKLSGLRTEQTPGASAAALAPYVDHLVATFGDRLMWGSDWPVLALAGDLYPDWLATARQLTRSLDPARRDWLFGGCAAVFYRFEPDTIITKGRS